MGFSSRGLALAVFMVIAIPGCWTGRLIEWGRLRESVVTFTNAALDGEELRLDYTVEVSDANEQLRSIEERSATVGLAALVTRPEQPVDQFSIKRVSAGSRTGREVPIALAIGQRGAWPEGTGGVLSAPMVLVVDEQDGRHMGFRLCPIAGDQCQGHLYSAALYRDHVAWWVYPIAPITAIVDLALIPAQAVTLPLLLYYGD
jgi:hypothetical protein